MSNLIICILAIICIVLLISLCSTRSKYERLKYKNSKESPNINKNKEAPEAVLENSMEDEEELIAVIAAAVMSIPNVGSGMIVRSIRRMEPAVSPWVIMGRQKQMNEI
ncbi:OadG family protein [Clostridium sp. AWRP]|uniref:OadG family protein n=1 Tax=Clostridium sp. AWRP TaxID=2212991 RepID=UPI000FD74A29|nr:OadG family protein [Clostridium sp. AWRP]AZV55632.1 hypothetical protein DMR38_02875 [Clostridium sp. AWRP]